MTPSLDQPLRNLQDVIAFEQTPEEVWLKPQTIYSAFRQTAENFTDKDALIVQPADDVMGDGQHISYSELLGRVHQVANMLLAAGLKPDETVTHLLPQSAEGIFTLIGAEAVGIVNAVNPLLEPAHIIGIMKAANSKVLIVPGLTSVMKSGKRLERLPMNFRI